MNYYDARSGSGFDYAYRFNTVASHREDFTTSALKYGYLRYCLTMNAHGDIKTTGWQEVWISPEHGINHGGGGGGHRSRMV